MGSYEFSLESVLQLRKTLKDLEVSRLEQEIAILRDIDAELEDCRKRMADTEGRLTEERQRRRIDVALIMREERFAEGLKAEEQQILERREGQVQVVEQRQAVLLELTREQKVMERLKARDFAAFTVKERKKAENAVDEMVLLMKKEEMLEAEATHLPPGAAGLPDSAEGKK